MLKKVLINLNGYLFYRKNKNLPNFEIILKWSDRQLQGNSTLDFQVAQYWHKQAFFTSPRNIISHFGATEIYTNFPKVLPRHYLHQTMKQENSLSCSEQPAPGLHPEQHKPSMRRSILYVLSLRFSKILSSRLCPRLFLKDFPNKTLHAFLFSPLLVTRPTELIG